SSTRPQLGSVNRRSSGAAGAPPAAVYSTTTVPGPFHVTPASSHAAPGFQTSSFCTPPFDTRQMASSLTQFDPQKSAAPSRGGWGETFGSAGRSTRRPLARCSAMNDELPASVANSTTVLISLTKSHSANVLPPWSASGSVNTVIPVG